MGSAIIANLSNQHIGLGDPINRTLRPYQQITLENIILEDILVSDDIVRFTALGYISVTDPDEVGPTTPVNFFRYLPNGTTDAPNNVYATDAELLAALNKAAPGSKTIILDSTELPGKYDPVVFSTPGTYGDIDTVMIGANIGGLVFVEIYDGVAIPALHWENLDISWYGATGPMYTHSGNDLYLRNASIYADASIMLAGIGAVFLSEFSYLYSGNPIFSLANLTGLSLNLNHQSSVDADVVQGTGTTSVIAVCRDAASYVGNQSLVSTFTASLAGYKTIGGGLGSITNTDRFIVLNGGATKTLPSLDDVVAGTRITIVQVTAGVVTINPSGSELINGVNAPQTLTAQWAVLNLVAIDSPQTWIIESRSP